MAIHAVSHATTPSPPPPQNQNKPVHENHGAPKVAPAENGGGHKIDIKV